MAKKLKPSQGSKPFLIEALFKGAVYFAVFMAGYSLFNSFISPRDTFQTTRQRRLKNPGEAQSRIDLIAIYLENNQFAEAEKELRNLQKHKTTTPQMKEIVQLQQEISQKDPQEITKQISAWENILEEYPDYRDGYLQIALLHLKLDQTQRAKEVFEKARELSPNSSIIKEAGKTLF